MFLITVLKLKQYLYQKSECDYLYSGWAVTYKKNTDPETPRGLAGEWWRRKSKSIEQLYFFFVRTLLLYGLRTSCISWPALLSVLAQSKGMIEGGSISDDKFAVVIINVVFYLQSEWGGADSGGRFVEGSMQAVRGAISAPAVSRYWQWLSHGGLGPSEIGWLPTVEGLLLPCTTSLLYTANKKHPTSWVQCSNIW